MPPIIKVPLKRLQVSIKFDPTIIMYLVIIDKIFRRDLFRVKLTSRFSKMLNDQVAAYINEGKKPPAAIAPAIMNIADDVMAKRNVVIRAGDYVALVGYAKAKGMM